MKPDKPRTWLNPQSSSFDQDIQALGGTIIHLQTSNQIFDPNSTTLLEPDPQKASLEATPDSRNPHTATAYAAHNCQSPPNRCDAPTAVSWKQAQAATGT